MMRKYTKDQKAALIEHVENNLHVLRNVKWINRDEHERAVLELDIHVQEIALASLTAPVVPEAPLPKNLDHALTIMGVGLPESKEEFNLEVDRWVQRLIDRVIRFSAEVQAHPVNPGGPVVTAPEFQVHANQPCWPSVTVGMRDSEWVATLKKAGIRVKD